MSLRGTTLLLVCAALLPRHIQAPGLTPVLAPLVLTCVVIFAGTQKDGVLLLPALICISGSYLVGLTLGFESSDALRTLAIYIAVLLATMFGIGSERFRWVLAYFAVQAVIIARISLSLALAQDVETAGLARSMILESDRGDIYSNNSWHYRFQLFDNTLIPLVFMVAFERWRCGLSLGVTFIILGAGAIAAGNLTYLLARGINIAVALIRRASIPFNAGVVTSAFALTSIAVRCEALDDAAGYKFEESDFSIGV